MMNSTPESRSSSADMAILDEIDIQETWGLMSQLSVEERLSGSPAEADALEHAAGYLADAGLTVRRYEYRSLIGFPACTRLRVVSPVQLDIPCTSYSMAPGTSASGLTTDLVWAGAGTPEDLTRPHLAGQVALCDGIGTAVRSMASLRSDLAAIISIDGERVHEMCVSPVRGTPTSDTEGLLPHVPQLGISAADGARLRRLLDDGPVTVALDVQPVLEWRPIPVLVGDVVAPGTDDFVLLSGHVDSWYHGAHDNASGNAAILTIGRLIQSHAHELRRGLRVALWSGHSHGRYSGSTWYADDQWDDLDARCVAHIEIDSLGGAGAEVVSQAPTMAETYEFGREIVRAATGVDLVYNRVEPAGDMPSFWGIGVPSLFGNFSFQEVSPEGESGPVGIYGWWWHRPEDTADKVDRDLLLRDVRAHLLAVWELCTRPVLPFRYSAAVAEIRAAVEDGPPADAALELGLITELCDRLRGVLDDFEAVLSTLPDDKVGTANVALRRLGRQLIPLNHKATAPWEQDLALPMEPVPALAAVARLTGLPPMVPAEPYRVAALRQRNRLTSGLRSAVETVEWALELIGRNTSDIA